MKTRVMAYRAATAVLVFAVLSGGLGELAHQWGTSETVELLGYPTYFLTILGVWKVLGAVALVLPRARGLKEWAYAGIVFNMTGAAASHAFVGDYGAYGFHVGVPMCLALLALASRALLQPTSAGAVRGARTWVATARRETAAASSS